MTEKEKASELITKFVLLEPTYAECHAIDEDEARDLAIVLVDEILWSLNDIDLEINMGDYIPWWERVRTELTNL